MATFKDSWSAAEAGAADRANRERLDADTRRFWRNFLPVFILALAGRLTLNALTRLPTPVTLLEWIGTLFLLLLFVGEVCLLFIALRPRRRRARAQPTDAKSDK
jgi:hypothetical protein